MRAGLKENLMQKHFQRAGIGTRHKLWWVVLFEAFVHLPLCDY